MKNTTEMSSGEQERFSEVLLTTFDEMVVRHVCVGQAGRKAGQKSVSQADCRQPQVSVKLTNAEHATGTMHY